MKGKVNSAKRPDEFIESSSAKAPENFRVKQPQKDKVLESISAVPSAKKDATIRCDQINAKSLDPIATLPSTYKEAMVEPEVVQLVEKKEEFVYKIPEGYKPRTQVLKEETTVEPKDYVAAFESDLRELVDVSYESIDRLMKKLSKEFGISPRKLHNDFKDKHGAIPDVWVKSHSVHEEITKTPMELLADRVAKTSPKAVSPADGMTEVFYENKVFQLENQLFDLRKLVLEVAQGTIVSGLGAGSPGSGETFINRMEDVRIPRSDEGQDVLADGDTLVWDSFYQRWVPGQAVGGGEYNTIINRDIAVLRNKLTSFEERLEEVIEQNGLYLRLEDGTTDTGGQVPGAVPESEFIDTIPDGDTTRFVVGTDRRGVYTLDGVSQPTLELPRGDILEFELSGLGENAGYFVIYMNGIPMEESLAYSRSDDIVRVNTSHINTTITKLYYRHANTSGLGWIINILDY